MVENRYTGGVLTFLFPGVFLAYIVKLLVNPFFRICKGMQIRSCHIREAGLFSITLNVPFIVSVFIALFIVCGYILITVIYKCKKRDIMQKFFVIIF